jgi:hypothetical protein
MDDFSSFLLDELPWLKSVAAWALGVFVVGLVFSIPSYLLYPLFRQMRFAIVDFLSSMAGRNESAKSARSSSYRTRRSSEDLKDGNAFFSLHSY